MKTLYAIAPLAVVLGLVGQNPTPSAPQSSAQPAPAPAEAHAAHPNALSSWPAALRFSTRLTSDRLPAMPIGQTFEARTRP